VGICKEIWIVRYKAKGYAQKEGIDYNEIFSPIMKHSSIRILLALVAQYDLEIDQLNVNSAFLHDDLDKELYMTQPMGSKLHDRKSYSANLRNCCKN